MASKQREWQKGKKSLTLHEMTDHCVQWVNASSGLRDVGSINFQREWRHLRVLVSISPQEGFIFDGHANSFSSSRNLSTLWWCSCQVNAADTSVTWGSIFIQFYFRNWQPTAFQGWEHQHLLSRKLGFARLNLSVLVTIYHLESSPQRYFSSLLHRPVFWCLLTT